MDLQSLTPDELNAYLSENVRLFAALSEEDRRQILSQAEDLRNRRLPREFVLSSVRSYAQELAAAAEVEAHPLDAERRKFIEEHALAPQDRIPAKRQPRNESKSREREELAVRIRGLLREARSARQPHERRKMRRLLMGIDQAHLQRSLGTEGQEFCAEIRELLLRSTDLR